MKVREDQFLGALLGLAIGDAFGMPVRGLTADEIAAKYGRVRGYLPGHRGDGEEIGAGEFTDESELALCIVESVTANGGVVEVDNIGARMAYLAQGDSKAWMSEETRRALQAADTSLQFQVPLNEDAPATGDVASRGVPIGLLHSMGELDVATLRADAEAVTRITHGSPAAITATTAVALGLRFAARGEIGPREWAGAVADVLETGELAERLRLAGDLLAAGTPVDEAIARFGTGPAALESVPAAFVAAGSSASFEDAVLAAINAGGATDTIGAIAGSLAGAASGVSDIPQRLIDGLESRIYVSLAAPWLYRAVRLRAGDIIELRRPNPPRPTMPPRI